MTTSKKYTAIGAVLLLVLGVWWFGFSSTPVANDAIPGRYMDIETYVRTNISEISPVKEQLGGTFQVTALEIKDSSGTVSYEDGHNAYTADFTYEVAEDGKPTVKTFEVRE